MKFSKKTAHRLIIALSMFAPVVYLFGAMFFGLAGAHGEKIYEDEIIVKQDYEELMTPENFSYDSFDWESVHGTRWGYSLGYLLCRSDKSFNLGLAPFGVSTNGVEIENHGLGFSGAYDYYVSIDNDPFGPSLVVDELVSPDEGVDVYIAFYMVAEPDPSYFWVFTGWSDDGIIETNVYFYDFINHSWVDGQEFQDTTLDDSVYWSVYFDDGRHLPEGVSFDDNLKSWFVPSVKGVSSSTYTGSIFGQFFPHDNFLERVGANALSAEPVGFAPFGTFLSYLDVNVFHARNSQIALMLYGMVYWSLHVIIADLVYHVAVFIPNIIQRVFDWFGQKGLDDD